MEAAYPERDVIVIKTSRGKKRFHIGQLVVYNHPHNIYCELGRVASFTDDGVFVCYSEGETGAKTPAEYLFPVINSACVDYSMIGGERFNGCSVH